MYVLRHRNRRPWRARRKECCLTAEVYTRSPPTAPFQAICKVANSEVRCSLKSAGGQSISCREEDDVVAAHHEKDLRFACRWHSVQRHHLPALEVASPPQLRERRTAFSQPCLHLQTPGGTSIFMPGCMQPLGIITNSVPGGKLIDSSSKAFFDNGRRSIALKTPRYQTALACRGQMLGGRSDGTPVEWVRTDSNHVALGHKPKPHEQLSNRVREPCSRDQARKNANRECSAHQNRQCPD